EKKGYVQSYKEKSGGRGGPSKVYTLARPRTLEREVDHSQALEPQAPHEALTDCPEPEEGVSGQEFSLYTNSPYTGGAIHEVDGLVEVGNAPNEKVECEEKSLSKNRANLLRKREGGQTVDDLPPAPVSRAELRRAILRKRATAGAFQRPDVLRLVESVRQAVYPHFAVEFYADQSKLYLYLCDDAQAFKRLEIDLSGGLSYAGVLQVANEVKQALQEVQSKIQNTVEEKQDETELLETFLSLAGLRKEDIQEVVAFATQIRGLGWKVQGSRLRWLIDGVEVDGLDLDLWELRGLSKEEAKDRVLIAIERVAEIEPVGG
ncbi:MAG: hypothetical protein RMK75_07905, partial [Aquificaceae bacterium]|nr:hypothetical protein [Aquificaceae bacterium]MDW8424224.1 hypothetical protein [Aquificaceae bacterium]